MHGFVNVYPFVFSYVADRFQYLASLSAPALALVVLGLLAAFSWRQSADYADSVTRHRATLERNPDAGSRTAISPQNWLRAESRRGLALAVGGRRPEARPHFEGTLELDPESAALRQAYGRVLLSAAELDGAVLHLR